MISYLIKRLLQGGLVLFLVTFFTFTVMYFMPGDPARTMVGQARVTDEQLELIREKWNLNDGFFERYWSWISNLLTGDLGISMMRPGQPITDMIQGASWMTIQLTSLAMLISLLVSIPIGVLAATRRNSVLDYLTTLGSTLGVAVDAGDDVVVLLGHHVALDRHLLAQFDADLEGPGESAQGAGFPLRRPGRGLRPDAVRGRGRRPPGGLLGRWVRVSPSPAAGHRSWSV